MLALTSSRVVLDDQLRDATVVVEGEYIREVRSGHVVRPGETHVAVDPFVLAPGVVDSHVHINEPGRTEWEGFATATQAAASGGVTTVVDMPLNCIPVTTTAAALAIKCEAAAPRLWIDVGFWGGVVPGNADDLAALAEAGVLGCKAFMVHSGIDEFPASDEAVLRVSPDHVDFFLHPQLDHGAVARARGSAAAAGGGLLADALQDKSRTESFACGTAAVVTPVGRVTRGSTVFIQGVGQGPSSEKSLCMSTQRWSVRGVRVRAHAANSASIGYIGSK